MTKGYTLAEIQISPRDQEQAASLANTGRCAFDAIKEMVAALECDYDRLEELRETSREEMTPEDKAELATLESAAGDCKDRDDAEQRILEHALSVEVRSGWHAPGDSDSGAQEFRILLATGGPAVRIVGELDSHGEPESATLQVQDWFLPWTDYRDADEETLLTYCRCFYFGED